MNFEKPPSQPPKERKKESEKRKPSKPSRWGALAGAAMSAWSAIAPVPSAEAQDVPRPEMVHIDHENEEISRDDLLTRRHEALRILQDRSALQQEGRGYHAVYEASHDSRRERQGIVTLDPIERAEWGEASTLQELEGETVHVSMIEGDVTHSVFEGGPGRGPSATSIVHHDRLRVLTIDDSVQVERTQYRTEYTAEGENLDEALGRAFQRLARNLSNTGRETELCHSDEGGRMDTLHADMYIQNNVILNLHISEPERLPDGGYRVTVSGDIGHVIERSEEE